MSYYLAKVQKGSEYIISNLTSKSGTNGKSSETINYQSQSSVYMFDKSQNGFRPSIHYISKSSLRISKMFGIQHGDFLVVHFWKKIVTPKMGGKRSKSCPIGIKFGTCKLFWVWYTKMRFVFDIFISNP